MGMFELIGLMSSKDGDELFEKITEILRQYNITTLNEDGSVKDLYTIACDVAEVLNKGRSVNKFEI